MGTAGTRSLGFLAAAGIFFGVVMALCAPAAAQPRNDTLGITIENVTVRGASLEGNLEGNSADRSVTVYLPPSYGRDRRRRYPVVYGLHGYTINNEIWAREINAEQSVRNAFAAGVPEMILVLPSAQTRHNGSMYSSSVTIGDWESFIARDLVAYIDANYRTIADRRSRGLVGHSMGGYGATRIGMKRPDVFGALYIMSPCCMSARAAPPAEFLTRLENIPSLEEAATLGFMERATLASAAAWSPNPNKPPFFVDLPLGDAAPSVLARWAANAPNAMVGQYIYNLRQYNGIAIDVGDQDGLKVDAEDLHHILTASGVTNTFEIYPGDHVSGVADRFENHVMPFFGRQLSGSPRR